MNRLTTSLSASLTISLSLIVSFFLFTSCKSKPDKNTGNADHIELSEASKLQKQAKKVIADDPNVELIEVQSGKLHIRNKYSKRSVTLPFQEIIAGNYEYIREDKELAKRINQIKKDKLKVSPPPAVLATTEGWGNTPTWIPRYPGLKVSPSKIHTAREDGSIWGYVTGSHSDSMEDIKKHLISGFKKSGLTLTRNLPTKNSLTMIFSNTPSLDETQQEKRKVTCSISRNKETTLLTIQYAYGM